MALRRFLTHIIGPRTLEGRVSDLRGRENKLVLPQCEACGFGTMRVQRPIDDPWEKKLEPGQTRLKCDRADCGQVVVAVSREVVPA